MSVFVPANLPALLASAADALRDYDKQLLGELNRMAYNLVAILDGGISLSDNVDADVITFTSNAAPNTEDAIAHGLGKIPAHFVVTSIDKGGVVYKSATAATSTHIYLKTTVASAAVQIVLH